MQFHNFKSNKLNHEPIDTNFREREREIGLFDKFVTSNTQNINKISYEIS